MPECYRFDCNDALSFQLRRASPGNLLDFLVSFQVLRNLCRLRTKRRYGLKCTTGGSLSVLLISHPIWALHDWSYLRNFEFWSLLIRIRESATENPATLQGQQ